MAPNDPLPETVTSGGKDEDAALAVRASQGDPAAFGTLYDRHVSAVYRYVYYRVRDDRFNPVRRALARDRGAIAGAYTPTLAAMLIYLNRTGFNGLFRLNGDEDALRAAARALDRPGVDLRHESFDTVIGDRADTGDFVYFDPPYAPLSQTSDFTSYTADGFTLADQSRLRDVVFELSQRGCHVVLSNSTAPEIAQLYDNAAARDLGLRALKVPARRAINSKASARGEIMEYIVTNVAG